MRKCLLPPGPGAIGERILHIAAGIARDMKYIRWLPEAKTGIRASVMNRNTSVRGTGYVFEPLNVKSERTFSGGMPGTNLTGRFNHEAPKGY